MARIGVIVDTMHPLLERIQERLRTLGDETRFIPWREIVLRPGAGGHRDCALLYLDRLGEDKRCYLAQIMSLAHAGPRAINAPDAYARARNKVLAGLALVSKGFLMPPTTIVHSREACAALLKPRKDYAAKSAEGVCSDEVFAFTGTAAPWDKLEPILRRDGQLIVQDFIANPDRFIWRVDIVDGVVVVANRRYAYTPVGQLPICNGTHGGKIVFLRQEEFGAPACRLAVDATRALELSVSGVDIVEAEDGRLYVLEVNPEPDITLDRYEFPYAIADFLHREAAKERTAPC